MFDRMRNLFHVPTAAEREMAYLSDSASRYDLELRQREIDQGKFRRRRGVSHYGL